MSGGGSESQTQQSGMQQLILPPWVTAAGQANYGQAQQVAAMPFQYYGGQMTAPMSANQQGAYSTAQNVAGTTLPYYQQAAGGFGGLMNYAPTNVSATSIQPQTVAAGMSNLPSYMNPYTQNVINTTLPIMQQQTDQAINQANTQAAANRAFGGTRSDVQQGIIRSQGALNEAQMAAGLNQAGFNAATGLLSGDVNAQNAAALANAQQNLQAQTTNAANANIAQSIRQAGAQGLLSTAAGQQGANTNDINNLLTTGTVAQTTQQAQDAAAYQQFQQAQQWPRQQLGVLLSALGMTPYDTTTMSSGTSDTKTSSSPDFMMAGLGGLSLLRGLFSEDDDKTDVKKLGKMPGTDLNAYAYRYKDDPKTYPKVVGIMASDVQKKHPSAVKRVGGKRVIDLTHLDAA